MILDIGDRVALYGLSSCTGIIYYCMNSGPALKFCIAFDHKQDKQLVHPQACKFLATCTEEELLTHWCEFVRNIVLDRSNKIRLVQDIIVRRQRETV